MNLDRKAYFFTPRYTRGRVCKVLGITKDTLRHYEKCGIIKPQENESNQYKYYSIADLEILSVILFLRAIDVPIQEIPCIIECKDIGTYGDFLDEQIKKVTNKINYWSHIKDLLSYLKKILDDYQEHPYDAKFVEDTTFRFRVAKFDYKNGDIEQMTPSKISSGTTYHIIKLKIVGEKWISSDREDTSDMIVGHLCGEEESELVCVHTFPQALVINTLETSDKLPQIIMKLWKDYEELYEFECKVYIIEHTCFNIFNQNALLRSIYLPIIKVKSKIDRL